MSSIAPDPSLNRASLDSLSGGVSLDDLRRQPGLDAPQADTAEPAYAPSADADTTDAGETVLNAAAWDGIPQGSRLLSGDTAFENALSALDLGTAADQGVNSVIAAFA